MDGVAAMFWAAHERMQAERARLEAEERQRSHIRTGIRLGGRRITDNRGDGGRTLCGGELTLYDQTDADARRLKKQGQLEAWVGCARCRDLLG